jgi:drug/metabolite transporter (DMT)-like permease
VASCCRGLEQRQSALLTARPALDRPPGGRSRRLELPSSEQLAQSLNRKAKIDPHTKRRTLPQILGALVTVYLIWGSTYLAIRIAIESMPPFLMAALRFSAAGAFMWIWAACRGSPAPTLRQWRDAGIIGCCLLLGGNGGVTYAEQFVPSGLTALLVATVPIFMTILAWLTGMTKRPNVITVVALLLGLTGVCVLSFTNSGGGSASTTTAAWYRGVACLLFAAAIWAAGSLFAKRADHPESPILSVGMQMLSGAAGLFLASALNGELGRLTSMHVTVRSFWAWLYLVSFGAIIAFSAYIWLVRH